MVCEARNMPLGLLAKDSIQDLEALAREADKEGSSLPFQQEPREVPADRQTDYSVAEAGSLDVSTESSNEFPIETEAPVVSFGDDYQSSAYEGFDLSYTEYSEYQELASRNSIDSSNGLSGLILGERTEKRNLFCCLFPFLRGQASIERESFEAEVSKSHHDVVKVKAVRTGPGTTEDDEMSSNSDLLGEKLTDQERQAVLARLRLAPPETTSAEANGRPPDRTKGLLNGIHRYEENGSRVDPLAPVGERPVQGILKNSTAERKVVRRNSTVSDDQSVRRRSLFPTAAYEKSRRSTNKHVSFAPMARVVNVKSKNDMAEDEKGDIWWQRSDYEDFRRCGRIITRAMLEGGSEIWLNASKSTGRPGNDSKSETGDLVATQGDKWWHTFGHSRRGLEHVVSVDEGRERQANVRKAIRAVLEEQNVQRLYKHADQEKLRSIALKNTTWARDLALAAGSSDADAVKANFAEDRKSREFYLLKMTRTATTKSGRTMPGFMSPGGKTPRTKNFQLDSHTATQIRYRSRHEEKKEISEPIHDRNSDVSASMARLAAGFTPDASEKVNMAAVLSGMGAVSKDRAGLALG